jgi:3-methylcrotonyl-CoA carboxylase alpha subunit
MSAPMPGVVLKVMAAVGDKVAKGTPLIVLEAMKMEHQLTAPTDGVVKKVNCREGELVQPGVDLIELE